MEGKDHQVGEGEDRVEEPDEDGLWDDLDSGVRRSIPTGEAAKREPRRPAKPTRNFVSRMSAVPASETRPAHPSGVPQGSNPYLITSLGKTFHWLGMEMTFLGGLWIGCAVLGYQVLDFFEIELDPQNFAIGSGVFVLVVLLGYVRWCRGKLISHAKSGSLVWLLIPGILLVGLFLTKVIPGVISGDMPE